MTSATAAHSAIAQNTQKTLNRSIVKCQTAKWVLNKWLTLTHATRHRLALFEQVVPWEWLGFTAESTEDGGIW